MNNSNTRSEHLHIRIAPEAKAKIQKLAQAERRSMSDMVEWLIESEYFSRLQTDPEFARSVK